MEGEDRQPWNLSLVADVRMPNPLSALQVFDPARERLEHESHP